MNGKALCVLPLLAASALATSPAEAVAAAHRDCARLPEADRVHQRYLSLYFASDAKVQAEWKRVLDFWSNSLSREAEPALLAPVTPSLWRLDLRAYQMPARVWEKLADADPYFHARVKVRREVRQHWPGGTWTDGRHYAAGDYPVTKEVEETAPAPWLPPKESAALVAMAQSRAPVVRADWWLVQTSQQAERKGTGYYDFLQVKDRKEFQAAVGLDQKAAERLQREVRAIVARSGVALNNRQVVRFGTITGAYWVTLDSNKSQNGSNAVRQLNGDYKHDAEEVYATLPNGLFAFFLGDAGGTRQDSAPDTIASDGQAPGNDRRVHVGVSCVRCHVEGIRPISDWGRRVYRSPLTLASKDHEKLRRLQRLYLSDLDRWVRRDQQDYAEALFKVSGQKPAEMARLFGRLHASYAEAEVTADQAAREAGVAKAQLVAAVKRYASANLAKAEPSDPLLVGLVQADEPLRREHFEEVFPLLMQILGGYKP